jgi:hypothetical protein
MFSLIERNIAKPIVQAGLVFTLGILLMVCAWLLTVTNLFLQDPLFPWSISSAFLLLFARPTTYKLVHMLANDSCALVKHSVRMLAFYCPKHVCLGRHNFL